MDSVVEEIAKGFLRGVGYILAELLFGTVCYWVGWPICKIITLGKYPSSSEVVYLDDTHHHCAKEFWCSGVGFLVILFAALYFAGLFS